MCRGPPVYDPPGLATNGRSDRDWLLADELMSASHLTLVHEDGVTWALFAQPSLVARDSRAAPMLHEREDKVVGAIIAGLKESAD